MNFEQVDKLVNDYTAKNKQQPQAAAAVQPETLKKIWGVAGPILKLVAGLPIIPAKWKTIVKSLIALLDAQVNAA